MTDNIIALPTEHREFKTLEEIFLSSNKNNIPLDYIKLQTLEDKQHYIETFFDTKDKQDLQDFGIIHKNTNPDDVVKFYSDAMEYVKKLFDIKYPKDPAKKYKEIRMQTNNEFDINFEEYTKHATHTWQKVKDQQGRKITVLSKSRFLAAYNYEQLELHKFYTDAKRKELAWNPRYNSEIEIRKLLSYYGVDYSKENVKTLTKQLLQTKAHLYGLENNYIDTILIFYSQNVQGCGKSSLMESILKPLDGFITSSSCDKLGDDFQQGMYFDNYAIFLDEMAKLEKEDIGTLKNKITMSNVSFREPYATKRITLNKNASLWGTANYSIDSVIRDSSGMRRYMQIEFKTKFDYKNLDAVMSYDYARLWKSINEKEYFNFYKKHQNMFDKISEKLRTKDDMELYIEYLNEKYIAGDFVASSNIYEEYRKWYEKIECKNMNYCKSYSSFWNHNVFPNSATKAGMQSNTTNGIRGWTI